MCFCLLLGCVGVRLCVYSLVCLPVRVCLFMRSLVCLFVCLFVCVRSAARSCVCLRTGLVERLLAYAFDRLLVWSGVCIRTFVCLLVL